MKRKNIFRISVAFWAMTAFTSCSDQFMQDKRTLTALLPMLIIIGVVHWDV